MFVKQHLIDSKQQNEILRITVKYFDIVIQKRGIKNQNLLSQVHGRRQIFHQVKYGLFNSQNGLLLSIALNHYYQLMGSYPSSNSQQIPSQMIIDNVHLQPVNQEMGSYPSSNSQQIHQQMIIDNVSLYPANHEDINSSILYRTVVAIVCPLPKSTENMYGSGVLLSKNIVLTAAHNIRFDRQDYRIYVGSDGSRFYQVEDWRYSNEFPNLSIGNRLELDYALIKLRDHPILPNNQFLTLSLPCQCILKRDRQIQLDIFGYPHSGDYRNNHSPLNPEGTQINLSLYGLSKRNAITRIEPRQSIVEYSISTEGGQSGCPVVFEGNKIIAIHTGCNPSEKVNFGRLITKDVLKNIKKWSHQLQGERFQIDYSERCSVCRNAIIFNGHYYFQQIPEVPSIEYNRRQTNSRGLQVEYLHPTELSHEEDEKHAYSLYCQGMQYQHQHLYERALQHYQQCLQIWEKIVCRWTIQTAPVLHKIGLMYYYQLKEDIALEFFKQALQVYKVFKGMQCVQSASILNNMGLTYKNRLDYEKALECYTSAFQIHQGIQKGSFQSALILKNKGLAYYYLRKYEKALECYTSSLQIKERIKGKGCFQSAKTLHNMGLAYKHLSNQTKALECCGLALEIYQRFEEKGTLQSANIINNMGFIYNKKRDYRKALQYYKTSQSIYEKFDNKDQDYGKVLFNTGLAYNHLEQYEEAASAFKSSLQVYERLKLQKSVQRATIEFAKCLKIMDRGQQLQLIVSSYRLENQI